MTLPDGTSVDGGRLVSQLGHRDACGCRHPRHELTASVPAGEVEPPAQADAPADEADWRSLQHERLVDELELASNAHGAAAEGSTTHHLLEALALLVDLTTTPSRLGEQPVGGEHLLAQYERLYRELVRADPANLDAVRRCYDLAVALTR